jgi:hypothetical protein
MHTQADKEPEGEFGEGGWGEEGARERTVRGCNLINEQQKE